MFMDVSLKVTRAPRMDGGLISEMYLKEGGGRGRGTGGGSTVRHGCNMIHFTSTPLHNTQQQYTTHSGGTQRSTTRYVGGVVRSSLSMT